MTHRRGAGFYIKNDRACLQLSPQPTEHTNREKKYNTIKKRRIQKI